MIENNWLVLLGGASIVQGKACIEQAQESGFKVALLDTPTNLDLFPHAELAEKIYPIMNFDRDSVLTICKHLPAINRYYSFKEHLQYLASVMNAQIGCPWTSPASIRTIQNKFRCRSLLRENGIEQPDCFFCHDRVEIMDALKRFTHQAAILKPVGRAGSEGVEIIQQENKEEISKKIMDDYFPYLVESFVDGEEYSLEAIICAGKCHCLGITKKFLFEGTFFEQGHVMPANEEFSDEQISLIYEQLRLICRITGCSHGVIHAEFWVNTDTIIWGEVHNRPGGDFISYMISKTSGYKIYASQFQNKLVKSSMPTESYMAVWSKCLTDQKADVEDTVQFRYAHLSRRNMFCTSGNTLHQALENARNVVTKSAI